MSEERPSSMAARVRVTRVGPGGGARGDLVVVEEPLRIHVTHRGEQHLLGSTMRTPGHDLELAVGLAVGEGVLRSSDDLVGARPCRDGNGAQPNEVTVIVRDEVDVDRSLLGRVSSPSSACGLCGRDEIDAIVAMAPPVHRDVRVDVEALVALPDAMRERQSVFRRTGGLHAAALATADGRILVVREDVGRHNAVDKVVGWAVMNGVAADVLVVSGRAGFEIVQKAAMAAIPVVVAVSAPTSLSVDVAQECGITLAAFVREGRANVYSAPERLVHSPARASL
ncbi:MAG TPA: formate dehydrogenase accessory sulfurtransferase FdhD [Candidatus Nanopelagicales bacterium]|nr:formate dehydrogenase accessory sulfurtransferase FdhD [Candidatus Nanopelagicales bacterium]